MFKLEILTNCISWFALVKKEPSPVADQQPAAPKKSFLAQKKEKAAPEPEKQEEAGDQFKLKKKSSVGPRKQLPAKEEEPAFGGFKLKKAETVKRQWDDGGLEGVNLKHHEFEKEPEVETVRPKQLVHSVAFSFFLVSNFQIF